MSKKIFVKDLRIDSFLYRATEETIIIEQVSEIKKDGDELIIKYSRYDNAKAKPKDSNFTGSYNYIFYTNREDARQKQLELRATSISEAKKKMEDAIFNYNILISKYTELTNK